MIKLSFPCKSYWLVRLGGIVGEKVGSAGSWHTLTDTSNFQPNSNR